MWRCRANKFSVPRGSRAKCTPSWVRLSSSEAVPSPPAATKAQEHPLAVPLVGQGAGLVQVGKCLHVQPALSH